MPKRCKDYKEYYRLAPIVVEEALKSACQYFGREVTVAEIIAVACKDGQAEECISPGNWSVFDFSDRVRRWLRQLIKKGKALELGDRRKYFYLPIDEPTLGTFTGTHITPDLPGELNDWDGAMAEWLANVPLCLT